ncbi:hypothetical protein [Pacificibacter marinus]|uniref:hypothetical protein n=1 Tax=Pacificibacter marinus TaxID=658057 RepID=UPI001C07135D|nr:hypothetical protein [Pacificibacter marinus]MBU2868101.1 hypothetical protein [Pacificibacter marinus]
MHKKLRHLARMLAVMISLTVVQPGMSQEGQRAGAGHLLATDFHEGAQDRWHSASYVFSDLRPFAEIQAEVETLPHLGVNIARDWSAQYLPDSGGFLIEPVQLRGGVGLQLSASKADMPYGVTWLGSNLKDQSSGQMVGALNVNLRF